MFCKGLVLFIMYIIGGSLLEHYFGFSSPAVFTAYGYISALVVVIVSHDHYNE